ncbi:MAG: hypothetical protein QXJ59_12155 [Thermofilaceae archaeon]
MSTPQKTVIDEKLLLDWGARIGLAARLENVRSAQLENLIASLDSVESREALLVAAAFALRQVERLHSGRMLARIVNQAMLDLYEKNAGKEDAKKMLGFAKWVYEALKTLSTPLRGLRPEQVTLEELLRRLASR